ncbi:Protein GL2-INTERACTING REPRESSOR 1 [Euphorbia peplus]|nr:Protein GL2-INTERACTING REPRESSOR 1 [Euphorbia peplus]
MSQTSMNLELKLQLSPTDQRGDSVSRWTSSSSSSCSMTTRSSSCISSGRGDYEEERSSGESGREEQVVEMEVVGCFRCLVYVIIASDVHPKCPFCNNTALLHFQTTTTSSNKPAN